MSATLRCLRSWIAGWAPPTLYGGIPGRGTDGVHSALFGALHQQQAGRCMAGAKADIQRCFDSVDFGVAFLVFDHLGAPAGLTEVLRFFYAGQTRWFISRGCVHPTPVRVQRGLLQGCPASPALLNAIMAIWSLAVTRAHPRIGLAIYLDDRSLWAQGRDAVSALVAAAEHAADTDRIFGFTVHPAKRECFALSPRDRRALSSEAALLGPVTAAPTLLGVTYRFGRAGKPAHTDLTTKLIQRCRKIGRVARSVPLRRALLQLLVASLFRWLGPWSTFPANTLRRWSSHMESALWGRRPPPGRDRYLFWVTFGPHTMHPEYLIHFEALRREWRAGSSTPCPTATAAFQFFRWTRHPTHWDTPYGPIRPAWDTERLLGHLAARSWLRLLWDYDTKTADPIRPTQEPVTEHLRPFRSTLDPHLRRVVLGCAADARLLARLGHNKPCACGNPCPSRTHLTFQCPLIPWSQARATDAERRLLTRLVTFLPATLDVLDPPVDLVHYLLRQRAAGTSIICMALDGSCLDPTGQTFGCCTAWAAAAADGHTFGGALTGADHTPHYAERMALWYVTAAAAAAALDVLVLTDNEAVARRFDSLLRYGRKAGDASEFWHQLLARWRPASRLAWIPAHGKRPGWTPPAGYPSPDLCRAMNAAADSTAKQLAHDHAWGWILHSGAGTTRCSAVGIYCCAATMRGDTRMVGPLLTSLRFSK